MLGNSSSERIPEYKSVPISEAQELALKYDKQEVIVLAIDRVHDKVHITTFGVTPKHCENAAVTGDFLREVLELEKPNLFFAQIERCKEIWKAARQSAGQDLKRVKTEEPEVVKCRRCGAPRRDGDMQICCM